MTRIGQRRFNGNQHRVEIIEELVISEADDGPAIRLQFRCPGSICFHLIAMLAAIQFDHQFRGGTGKIGQEPRNRVLASKLPLGKAPVSQRAP